MAMKKGSGVGKFHPSSEESLKEEALGQICEQALEPQTGVHTAGTDCVTFKRKESS